MPPYTTSAYPAFSFALGTLLSGLEATSRAFAYACSMLHTDRSSDSFSAGERLPRALNRSSPEAMRTESARDSTLGEFHRGHQDPRNLLRDDIITHDDLLKIADVGHLTMAEINSALVPAVPLTRGLWALLHQSEKELPRWEQVLPLLEEKQRLLDEEVAVLNSRLATTPRRKVGPFLNTPDGRRALRIERRKKAEQLEKLTTVMRVYADQHIYNPTTEWERLLRRKLARSGLLPEPDKRSPLQQLDDIVQKTVDEERALSWSGTDMSGGSAESHYSNTTLESGSQPEVLQRNLEKARAQYIRQRDFAPGSAALAEHESARQCQLKRLRRPPSTVIGQYGVIKESEAVLEGRNAERKYRAIKRRMRQKDMKIERALSEDTEFSWDPEESGEGSGGSDEDITAAKYRTRKWDLAPRDIVADPGEAKTPPLRSVSDLKSMSIGSQVTNLRLQDRKYRKRRQMFHQLERERTISVFEGRLRAAQPPKRKRRLKWRLNEFTMQMPEVFRYTNAKPAHPNRPAAPKNESAPSSHGSFEWWDRANDPMDEDVPIVGG